MGSAFTIFFLLKPYKLVSKWKSGSPSRQRRGRHCQRQSQKPGRYIAKAIWNLPLPYSGFELIHGVELVEGQWPPFDPSLLRKGLVGEHSKINPNV